MFRKRPVTPIHVMIAKGNDKAVKSVSSVPSVAVKSTDDTYAFINKAAMNLLLLRSFFSSDRSVS